MNENSELGPARAEDKRVKPPGLLPKNTQQFVILGVALVMVLILWLSGGTKRTITAGTAPTVARVEPPNPASVADFKESLQKQQAATRQPISPSSLERLQALGLAGDVPPGASAVPPREAGVAEPGGIIGSASPPQGMPDPVREDRKKREYLSLFAPNAAFTYRQGPEAEQLLGSRPQAIPRGRQDEAREQPSSNEAPPETLPPTSSPSLPKTSSSAAEERPHAETAQADTLHSSRGKKYVAFEGTVLETLLINRLDGTFAGPVNCLVTNDVYSHDRQHVLIPTGSKVLGEAKKVEAFGQQRLAVFFHRLIMPDGYSVSLEQFKGLNQIGETALRDKVNNHYLQLFGASLAVGFLAGVAQAGTGDVLTNSPLDRVRAGFGGSLATSSMNILDRFLNILPTVTIREGNRVKVYLSGDLLLPDYTEHTMDSEL